MTMLRPQHTEGEVHPVRISRLIFGRKAPIVQAYMTRLTFTGFKIAKMGGWL